MNPFEKIFNHQIISRLDDSGTFMVTSHERTWLKTMLEHPAAAEAFMPETLDKLRATLEPDPVMEIFPHLVEKARSLEKQVYHPLLRPLHRLIMNQTGIRITCETKQGRIGGGQPGLPYKLEYSMVKREWYLLWLHARKHAFMSTRLSKIHTIAPEPIDPSLAERLLSKLGNQLDSRKSEIVVEIVPTYNEELSRILYAFSSFEKKVEYDAEKDTYRVGVTLLGNETEYFLSKLRFLGKRVRVIQGDYLKKRMLEASTKALERYETHDISNKEEGS